MHSSSGSRPSTDKSPAVSVLMAVYNGCGHVHLAIESILSQSFKDFEFVIVNDGSTDETHELLQNYSNRDQRIHIIKIENSGLTKALNIGLSRCRGKYIARQDADDISLPIRLETQYKALEEHETNVLVGSRAVYMRGNRLARRFFKQPPSSPARIKRHLEVRNIFIHTSLMFQRTINGDEVSYDMQFQSVQDFELITRLSSLGRIINLRKKLVIVQLGENSNNDEKLVIQQTNAIVIALINAYPELSYLKKISGKFLTQELTDLQTKTPYAARVKLLEYYYGTTNIFQLFTTLETELLMLVFRHLDLILMRLCRSLVRLLVRRTC